MTYTIYYIGAEGITATSCSVKAPTAAQMNYRRSGSDNYVARFYLSKKIWRLFDLRKFRKRSSTRNSWIIDVPKPSLEAPSVEACIMFAVLKG